MDRQTDRQAGTQVGRQAGREGRQRDKGGCLQPRILK